MSVIDAIDALDKLESDDTRSFTIASAVLAKSVQLYNDDASASKTDALKLLYEIDSADIIQQQKVIENECSDTNSTSISFSTILDSCLGPLSSKPAKVFEHPLYLPFRPEQPIDYDAINWQTESTAPTRFIVQPPVTNGILKPSNEPNNDNNTNTIVIDDNDEKNYIDAIGDEENEVPKVITKKKGKKKKQQVQATTTETTTDSAVQLNTSSNRTSTTGYKFPKLSSKWSSGKRISGIGVGKTSAIRKFARPSNDRQNRGDSRTLVRSKPSVTTNTNRLSQEQRDQLARAADERKQEERKRKVEKLHEQAKKREEVLSRAKAIQQDKEQKNQLRISDNQSKNTTINQVKKNSNNNNSTLANNSMNESTAFAKPAGQQYKPVVLDTTSNKIFNQNKVLKNPINALKKPTTNAEYTFVVDKTNPLRNDITLPSSSMAQSMSQYKADWTILPTSGDNDDELELDSTMTKTNHHTDEGDYGIDDMRSDLDSDNDDDDEMRIPNWAKERLLQTFWTTQGHWYLSRRVLKLTRRTFGHYPVIKDELQIWLRDLKSSKPLSETFTDATYLDQTQAYF